MNINGEGFDTNTTISRSEALIKAAEIIEARGLRKGHYGTPDGPVCMLGAMSEVLHGAPDMAASFAVGQLAQHVSNVLDRPSKLSKHARCLMYVDEFNDQPETTAVDVINLLVGSAYLSEVEVWEP